MSGCSPEGVHSPVRRAGSCQTKARRTRRNDSGSHPPPSRTHKAAAPETTAHPERTRSAPGANPERTRSARTTQPQPPRSGAGGAVAGLSRAPIGRAFAGKQGDACLSERSERVCIAAPRTFARSGSRRPRTSARLRPRPRQTDQPAQAQALQSLKPPRPHNPSTPRRLDAPRPEAMHARIREAREHHPAARAPPPQAPESAIIPPLRAKPAGF